MHKTGIVIWFSRRRGYGFIRPDDRGQNIFVHYSGISGDGHRVLKAGQRVEYDIIIDPRYPAMFRASDVIVT